MDTLVQFSHPYKRVFLAVLTGILLGVSFPPIPVGITVFFGFIPFFLLLESLETYSETIRFSYLALFVWHGIVGYWAGGFAHARDFYMMAGGGALLLLNPFFYLIPILAFQFFRRYFGWNVAIYAFPFFWIGVELFRAHTELALPWLTLGNTQTYQLPIIQIASITGVYGISFWILILNVLFYFFIKKIFIGERKILSLKSFGLIACIIIVYLIPLVYGIAVMNEKQDDTRQEKIKVALIQPNIDPFEKWERDSREPLQIHQEMTGTLSGKDIDLVIWSETAIPFYLLHPNNTSYLNVLKNQVDSQHVNLFTGVPTIMYYKDGDTIPSSSKTSREGIRYDNYNSAILLQPGIDSIQTYRKMLLVPFAERVPYSEELSFLNAMQWNMGLGGWGVGRDHTLLHFKTGKGTQATFSGLICFESIFPGFVSENVKKGANFLSIITIDSWWGNTSGVYQHKQNAVLRAVENRRWIARCATGGITCIINPFGVILQESDFNTKQILTGEIELRSDLTFYSIHGDWFAEFCLWIAAMCVISAVGKKFYLTIRKQQG